MQRTPREQFERDRTALKNFLVGRNYPEALAALGHAERWHTGFRKNKVTPEFHHQIGVVFNFLNTPIDGLTRKLESAAIAALLNHDVVEDYPVKAECLRKAGLTKLAVNLVQGLTKAENETLEQFLERLLGHWLLPIMKGCDRDNNVMTMAGAFSVTKMRSYIAETRSHILPLLKLASNKFPEHHRSYSTLAHGIKKQLHIYEAFLSMMERQAETERQLTANVAFLTESVNTLQGELLRRRIAAGEVTESLLDGADPAVAEISNLGPTTVVRTL